MKALFEKHFFRVKNYKRGKSEASRERFFMFFNDVAEEKRVKSGEFVCFVAIKDSFVIPSKLFDMNKNFTKKWGFESKFPICKSSKCYIFDHRKNKITVDLRNLVTFSFSKTRTQNRDFLELSKKQISRDLIFI